ncbi:hfsB [Brevundimonas fluminis]|uniref:hfsB n=1 Tax=Brevundimonas fluminis TaxID=2487274 RepID=UPI000F658330|nr:hfsB [Brevundimonas fluminis]
MIDLTSEMAALWSALGPAPARGGRMVLIVSALSGEGASTVSREYARLAAVRARRPVWLIDADLDQPGQQEAVAAAPDRFGTLSRPAFASPDGSCFFDVHPPAKSRDGRIVPPARLLTARSCLGGRLWVSRFAAEAIRVGQRVEASPDPAYWNALRPHAEIVVVDCPAAERSDTALVLAPLADAVVLVVAAESTGADEASALRQEIEAVGGRIAGVVLNRTAWKPPGFLSRLTG